MWHKTSDTRRKKNGEMTLELVFFRKGSKKGVTGSKWRLMFYGLQQPPVLRLPVLTLLRSVEVKNLCEPEIGFSVERSG